MRVVATHSHKGAKKILESKFAAEYQEILDAIAAVDVHSLPKKTSKEKTMAGKELFSPVDINKALKAFLYPKGWAKPFREKGVLKYQEHSHAFEHLIPETGVKRGRTLKVDGLKNKVGLEIQLGKYAFVPFDMFVKLPIFYKEGMVEVGIEIVPMLGMITDTSGMKTGRTMSSGIGPYEQFAAEIIERGEADIDCPILLIGIDAPVGVTADEADTEGDDSPVLNLGL